MPYTVVINGIQVQCETAEEAVELARRVQSGGGRDQPPPRDGSRNGTAQSRWTEQRVNDFYRNIKAQQRKLLDALLEHPDGRTDDQLLQVLDLNDNRALAGVLTGLWKNAKKTGADPDDLYRREVVRIGDHDVYEYTLTDGFRRAAKAVKDAGKGAKS